jgi:hypothetical protein
MKSQITNPKFQINPNKQNLNVSNKILFDYFNLNFGNYLGFGAWDLEF